MISLCLDKNFSTTRLIKTDQPFIEGGLNRNFFLQPLVSLGDEIESGGIRKNGYFKSGYKKINQKWYEFSFNGLILQPVELSVDWAGEDLPLITVVTVVFNGADVIEETIKSVIYQNYPNIEYIIIDGGSTDNTLNIIRRYEKSIDYWISEPDAGIYDAMNKGVKLASGSWINFMNAGDVLNGANVFEVMGVNNPEVQIYYSDTILVNKNKRFLAKANVRAKAFIHQSMIYRTDLHKRFGLYLSVPKVTISDYLFFYNIWREENAIKLSFPISNCRIDGVSSNPAHYYQKIAVNLMCGHGNLLRVLMQILYKSTLQVFYYPVYKLINKYFLKNN